MNVLITALSSAIGPSGICRHACNLVRCAAEIDEVQQIILVIGKWQKPYFYSALTLGGPKLTVVIVDISNNAAARNLWYFCALPNLAAEVVANIIHLSFPVPIRRKRLRCPVVLSLHDLYPYDEPMNFGFPRVFFNRAFLKQSMNKADWVACVSESTLSRVQSRFPRAARRKSAVIYNCITISISPIVPPAFGRGPFILLVGQHRANKNIAMALRVFANLLQTGKINARATLFIVGNRGPQTVEIESIVKKMGLRDSVNLIETVTDEELRWLYKNCELLIAPSSIEGFGLPVAEALTCGSRVVCSDIAAFREVGGNACHYFDLHGESPSDAMSAAICDALGASPRPTEALDRFSVKNIAKEYTALYLHLKDTL